MELLIGFGQALASIIGFAGDGIVVAVSTTDLANGIRDFVGPLVMIAAGIAALGFLWQRQFTQMLIFIVIAIFVFAVFYAPQFLANIGQSFGESNKDLTWSK